MNGLKGEGELAVAVFSILWTPKEPNVNSPGYSETEPGVNRINWIVINLLTLNLPLDLIPSDFTIGGLGEVCKKIHRPGSFKGWKLF